MKKTFFIITTLITLSCTDNNSCSSSNLKEIMGEFYNRKIIIPDEWVLLNDDKVSPQNRYSFEQSNSPFVILYYFSIDCDQCVIEFKETKKFLDQKKQEYPNTKFVFIGTGDTDVFAKEAIAEVGFDYPFFFEKTYYKFKTTNKIPLDNPSYYKSMLLNENQNLILFASIFDNEKAENYVKEIINCLSEDKKE